MRTNKIRLRGRVVVETEDGRELFVRDNLMIVTRPGTFVDVEWPGGYPTLKIGGGVAIVLDEGSVTNTLPMGDTGLDHALANPAILYAEPDLPPDNSPGCSVVTG